MHDCPRCGVPLHGYEKKCPSCDAPQRVSRSLQFLDDFPEPKVNWGPVILVTAILVIGFVWLAKSSWIGELFTQRQQQENTPTVSYQDVRNTIKEKLEQSLAQAGATAEIIWKSKGAEVDISCPDVVQLYVRTALRNPNDHNAIVDPVKDDMDKANLSTLTMTDFRSHATWTYTVNAPAPAPPPDSDSQ